MSWETVWTQGLTVAATLAGAWVVQFASHGVKRLETRNNLMTQEILKRERIYGDFLGEWGRLLTTGSTRQLTFEDLEGIQRHLAQIRLVAESSTTNAAAECFNRIVKLVSSSENPGDTKRFVRAARAELDALRAKLARMNE